MAVEIWLLWLVGAFLCGSIPFAVILGKAKGVDIRKVGSGNPGATNLGRAVGKKWGFVCFGLDVAKGLVPTLLYAHGYEIEVMTWVESGRGNAFALGEPETIDHTAGMMGSVQWVLIAVAAVCGHVFSPFLKFKGGKGVATGLGAALGLFPIVTVPGLIAFALWYAVCKLSGYVGLASVIAAGSLPVLTIVSGLVLGLSPGEIAVFAGLTGVLAALVIVRHRGNLARIRAGTEPKAAWTGKARPSASDE
ncbi:glycerol-3-phosphate 1-O-acyltransferase PlsY [Algisphaera agarilytica]|uniref:Glycerol-3-phosphate acyltransferase n=1 Tax=Algisphaera agarilytica TaxID=1385975 RepID=A0A7X0H4F4_9BACT|nr:glycerol-3-phosphate 1-O-acyltransferase PlsY [Algisphaera agarilytica]MBB6429086.1 glycerol-3-phosphate acyltransferase PlsY [Algisphaera agarilytica]